MKKPLPSASGGRQFPDIALYVAPSRAVNEFASIACRKNTSRQSHLSH